MSIELEEWYRKRFAIRIEKKKLISHGAKYWHDFTEHEKTCVLKQSVDSDELFFGFFGDCDCWTLIGVENIYSFYDGKFVQASLDKINGEVYPVYDDSLGKEEVLNCGLLRLEVENKIIWVPKGQAILGLSYVLIYTTNPSYFNNRPSRAS